MLGRSDQPGCVPPKGFTLIEVIVCIGVVMVLLGLALPAVSGARNRAKLTRSMSDLRQDCLIAGIYSKDHGDVYPMASSKLWPCGLQWYEAVIAAGYSGSKLEIDPEGTKRVGIVTFAMSFCMFTTPGEMTPGQTRLPDFVPSTRVTTSQIAFPSSKGWLYQLHPGPDLEAGSIWCCTDQMPLAPVSMADSSTSVAKWTDFKSAHEGLLENWVGLPIVSTWDAYMGTDK